MNFPASLFPPAWQWAGHGLFVLALAWCAGAAPWHRLKDSGQQHVWLGAMVFLALLWTLRAGVRPGLEVHFIGAAAATLMFGAPLAVITLSLVLLGTALWGGAGLGGISLAGVFTVVLPVAVARGILVLAESFLPPHFFVYVFVNGFFGVALGMVAVGAGLSGALAAAGVYPVEYLTEQYFPYFLLLAWGEAFMTGMALTLMVVYRPHWVVAFDDARYIRNR